MARHIRKRAGPPWANYLAAVAAAVVVGGCQLPAQQAALGEHEAGAVDLAEALTAEQKAFAEALAHFALAQTYEVQRDYERALAAYDRARQADPEYLPTYMRMAINLLRQRKGEDAVTLLRELAERHPDKAQPLIWLGSVYRQKHELDQALDIYSAALEIYPTETALYLTTADLLFQLGREDEALAQLQAGIDAGARSAPLRRVRGEVYTRRAAGATDSAVRRHWRTKALDDLEAAWAAAPNDTDLLMALGDLQLQADNGEAAIAHFERLLRRDPTNALALERMAQAYEQQDELESAAGVLEQLAKLQPTNARVFMALGALYETLDERAKAIVNYQLAARAAPQEPTAYLKLGLLKMEDEPQAAITALETGLEQRPEDPRIWEMLAYLKFNEARYADAINAFRAAERYTQAAMDRPVSMSGNFYLYLALAYYYNRQTDDVPEVLGQALEQNPDALEAFAHLILADDETDRAEQAIPIFEALYAAYPEEWAIPAMLGYIHSFREEYEEALDLLDRVYNGLQDHEDADDILTARFFFWYAAAHERNKDYARAEELFYQSLERDPDNAETYNYLAYMWAENDMNLEQAKTYVLRALEDRPDSGAFIDTLGWIYFKQGRYDDAYREIQRALDKLPDDPVVLDHMGDIYLALDQPDKAIAKWKRAFEKDPDKEDVARKLATHDVDVLKETPPDEQAPDEETPEPDTDEYPTVPDYPVEPGEEPVPDDPVVPDEMHNGETNQL